MSWPVDNLVAHFCACQCQPPPPCLDGLYELTLSGTHRFGVMAEDGEALLLFAHPRPVARARAQAEAGAGSQDLELASDEFGRWWLRVNRALSHTTVWARVPQAQIGHAEFPGLVARLREHVEVWEHVLSRPGAARRVGGTQDRTAVDAPSQHPGASCAEFVHEGSAHGTALLPLDQPQRFAGQAVHR